MTSKKLLRPADVFSK